MYYRMPPALKAAQFGSLAPPPRYYDYTEEFEPKQIPAVTTVERVASVTTRAPTAVQRPLPLVLREGSEEELANIFGTQIDPAFDADDSQPAESQAETEPHLLSDVQFEDLLANDQTALQLRSALNSRASEEQDPLVIRRPGPGPENLSRGSDIDLLPSQIGRSSVDTFRPSLDIECKGTQTLNYPKLRQSVSQQTNTPSPARQVQVHGGKTPTIKSEQGIIFRNDLTEDVLGGQSRCSQEYNVVALGNEDAHFDLLQGPSRWFLRSDSAQEQPEQTFDPEDHFEDSQRCCATTESAKLDSFSVQDASPENSLDKSKSSLLPLNEPGIFATNRCAFPTEDADIAEVQTRSTGAEMTLDISSNTKERLADQGLELDMDLPSRADPNTPQLTPSCSLTPLTAPKPISPVRELRVRNSIPHLMKALPPLPGELRYVSPSPSTILDGEDEYAQILTPYVSLDDRNAIRKPRLSFSLRKPLPEIQKKLPRIRIKSKGPGSMHYQTNRDSRPWNSDSNYPWCNDSPPIALGETTSGEGNRSSLGRRLKLRVPRDGRVDSPISTVRHHPEAHRSEPVEGIPYEKPDDLFSFPNAIGSAFRQAGRKISHGSTRMTTLKNHRNVSSSSFKDTNNQKSVVKSTESPSTLKRLKNRTYSARRPVADGDLTIKQRRGLRKRLSNLKWLSTGDLDGKTCHQAIEETRLLNLKKDDDLNGMIGLDIVTAPSDNLNPSQPCIDFDCNKPRFKRRVNKKLTPTLDSNYRRLSDATEVQHGEYEAKMFEGAWWYQHLWRHERSPRGGNYTMVRREREAVTFGDVPRHPTPVPKTSMTDFSKKLSEVSPIHSSKPIASLTSNYVTPTANSPSNCATEVDLAQMSPLPGMERTAKTNFPPEKTRSGENSTAKLRFFDKLKAYFRRVLGRGEGTNQTEEAERSVLGSFKRFGKKVLRKTRSKTRESPSF
ncbi:hypothetical protein E8E14_005522 [Neopestalotiopsis sp. 37M]|nr:hypothetical protein E8E14_005522 [Neopestalotiopsis sp. 37M]